MRICIRHCPMVYQLKRNNEVMLRMPCSSFLGAIYTYRDWEHIGCAVMINIIGAVKNPHMPLLRDYWKLRDTVETLWRWWW